MRLLIALVVVACAGAAAGCAKDGDWARAGYEMAQGRERVVEGPNSERADAPQMSYDEYKDARREAMR